MEAVSQYANGLANWLIVSGAAPPEQQRFGSAGDKRSINTYLQIITPGNKTNPTKHAAKIQKRGDWSAVVSI